jgi:hypothetical protein
VHPSYCLLTTSGVPDDDTDFQLLGPGHESSVSELQEGPPPAEPPKVTDLSQYEPLGVWIVDWARLFPWLVTGHDNAVTPGLQALDWIRLKILHQDCLSLTWLYDRLDGEVLQVPGKRPAGGFSWHEGLLLARGGGDRSILRVSPG